MDKIEKKGTGQDFSGIKALVMGLGLNGGGLESARYLGLRGAELCVTDIRDEKVLAPSIEKLDEDLSGTGARVRYVLGRHEISDFEKADLVIKNPGVRYDSPYLLAAKRVETDISLFLANSVLSAPPQFSARLTAVTGSKGKSSTSSALHWVLKKWHGQPEGAAHGRAFLGGNITVSPLGFLDEVEPGDDIVLELSSWQLGDLRGRTNEKNGGALLKPRAAVITAIMPDHLDRYGSMEAYVNDKRVIYQGQDERDCTVAGDDSWGMDFLKETHGRPLVYPIGESDKFFEAIPEKLPVPGSHQRTNLIAASLALLDLGLPADFIRESFGTYTGIEHRLEFFCESRGIRFYNDSAATIPEAAAAAIRAFEPGPVLVCGGTDKQLDFSPLAEAAGGAKALVLLEGSGTEKLIPLLKQAKLAHKGPFASIEAALGAALESADEGDAVVLSPGCASFGMFLNEFDRGRKWKALVTASLNGRP